jgi:3-oxoacyl-[acyl-carrier-protein] synthase III
MGNTIPVSIEVQLGEEVYTGLHKPSLRILVTNGEGMTMEARPVEPEDVHPMNT